MTFQVTKRICLGKRAKGISTLPVMVYSLKTAKHEIFWKKRQKCQQFLILDHECLLYYVALKNLSPFSKKMTKNIKRDTHVNRKQEVKVWRLDVEKIVLKDFDPKGKERVRGSCGQELRSRIGSSMAQLAKNLSASWRPRFHP